MGIFHSSYKVDSEGFKCISFQSLALLDFDKKIWQREGHLKALFFVFFLGVSFSSFACELIHAKRHVNPDGTMGGFVSKTAHVESTAYIAVNAKVCGSAWIHANSKILDQAIVKENAWVREFSTIEGYAVVSGSSVAWGTKSAPVKIGGQSKVYGAAKILSGTTVDGSAAVYGNVTLKNSTVSQNAKVCEGYILSDQKIYDDYFCNSLNVESNIQILISNINLQALNPKPHTLILKPLNARFSPDSNVYVITLNDQIIEPSDIVANRGQIQLSVDSYIVEGFNTLSISGKDEYGKRIHASEIKFITGSSSKAISLNFESNVDPDLKFKVNYKIEGEIYDGKAAYSNGNLELLNLPIDFKNYTIELSGVGRESFVLESFSKVEDIPSELTPYLIPEYVNSDGGFSDNLASWKKSHPENVSIVLENEKAVVKILGDDSERVEISKLFKLSSFDAGLSLETILPSISKLFYESSPTIEFALVSMGDKTISYKKYSSSDFTSKVTIDTKLNSSKGGEFLVYIRLNPSNALKYPLTPLTMVSASKKDYFLQFIPYHLNAKNVKPTPLISTINPNCEESSYFDVGEDDRFNIGSYPTKPSERMLDESFKFFSAGSSWFMSPQITENRIHARYILYTNKPEYHVIENPTLLIVQGGDVRKEIGLSKCVKHELDQMDFKDQFDATKNLVKYMFSIPFPNSSDEEFLNTSPGARVSLFLKAKVSNGHDSFYKLSNEVDVPVLVASSLERAFWFGVVPPVGLDHYDSPSSGMLRTGGDKWLMPYYKETITNILWINSLGWKINDFSKLNGGHFPGHVSHNDGLNGDLSTAGFNFQNISDDNQWDLILDKIESFFLNNEIFYNIIYTSFLTRSNSPADQGNDFGPDAIDSRFRNRCLGGHPLSKRYISFNKDDIEKSLLRHSAGHEDHLHVRFNDVYSDTGEPIKHVLQPLDYDLDDLWFEIVKETVNGTQVEKIQITPRDEDNIPAWSSIKILWRFQDSKNFDTIDYSNQYGRWPSSTSYLNESNNKFRKQSKPSMIPIKHLYVTFADINSGSCVQRYIEVDMDTTRKLKRWTFNKSKNRYFIKGL